VWFVSLLFFSIAPVTALEIEDTYLGYNDTYQIEPYYEKAEVELKEIPTTNSSVKLKSLSSKVVPRMESFIYTFALVVSVIILCRLLYYAILAIPGNEYNEAIIKGWYYIVIGMIPVVVLAASIEFDW
jgi:hypothetical protein